MDAQAAGIAFTAVLATITIGTAVYAFFDTLRHR